MFLNSCLQGFCVCEFNHTDDETSFLHPDSSTAGFNPESFLTGLLQSLIYADPYSLDGIIPCIFNNWKKYVLNIADLFCVMFIFSE